MSGGNEAITMADQQTNTIASPGHEEPITEFRNQCRKFYRRSTSVVQSSGSLPGLLDEDAMPGADKHLPPKKDGEIDKKSRVVVEAIERLVVEQSHNSNGSPQAQSYASFQPRQGRNTANSSPPKRKQLPSILVWLFRVPAVAFKSLSPTSCP